MRGVRITLGLALLATVAAAAEGQGIGGLIKKKVGDAVKPKEEQAAKPAPKESSPFAFELTDETMAAFKRGVELEIKMREDYRARVAKLKTPAQYEACSRDAIMGPDGMKFAEEQGARMEKVKTSADMEKLTAWANETMNALVLKHCGEDPNPLIQQQQKEFTKAQEAGALEFAKSWKKPPSHHDQPGNREQEDAFRECDAGDSSFEGDVSSMPLHLGILCEPTDSSATGVPVQEAPNASTDARVLEYLKLRELLEKFCSLSKELRAEAAKNGIRVPGSGQNIYWVFSRGFAIWVGDDCDHLMKLFSLVT